MYSQNQEEEVFLQELPKLGRLLDIGAFDGVNLSNSRALLEQGWTGVLVEPSPITFGQLIHNTEVMRDRVTLVNAAVTGKKEPLVITFYDSMGDAISGYDENHLVKWKKPQSWRPIVMQTIPVDTLISAVGTDFDFVSIDTEGTNWDLIQSMPWGDMPRVKIVCVEYDNLEAEMIDWMKVFSFKVIHRNGENLIFQRNVKE